MLGKVLNLERYPKPVEIVGVVKHVNQWGLDKDDHMLREQLYLSFMQMPDAWMKQAAMGTTVMVRTDPGTPGVFEAIHKVVMKIDNGNTIYGPQTMNEIISESLATKGFR